MTDPNQLFTLIQSGDIDAVREHMSTDSEVGLRAHESGVSAIVFACYCHQFAIAAALAEPLELGLLEAAAVGDAERLSALLAAGSDTATRSPDGFTPLHYACYFGHEAAARVLLEAGADAEAVADNGTSLRPIHSATASKKSALVRLLLEHGVDPNTAQAGGYTALHSAAQHHDQDMMAALIAAGADPDAKADDGKVAADFGPLPD